MAKITIETASGKQYDAYISPTGYGKAEVNFYEVKNPKRKHFFRTKFFPIGSKTFWVEDFSTIRAGAENCLWSVLARRAKEKEVVQKWKDFEREVKKNEIY